jgi:DNA-binding response OmpR family regulator
VSARDVLVVEDDREMRSFLERALRATGSSVTAVDNGRAALAEHDARCPDVVLLDLDLPDMDGLDVLTALRTIRPVPVIVVSGRRSEADRVLGLDRGADDYLVKPFSGPELHARIRAVLRRVDETRADELLEHDGLAIDLLARTVTVDGVEVRLRRREFDLLAFLAAHPGRAFTRQELLARVWHSSNEWQVESTVTEHFGRIRRTIDPNGDASRWVQAVRGIGYRFGPAREG